MNKFLFENLGDILRPELIENASEMDRKRDQQLEQNKQAERRLEEWNQKVTSLNALLIRNSSNPPTDFDFKRLNTCIHFFSEVINKNSAESE